MLFFPISSFCCLFGCYKVVTAAIGPTCTARLATATIETMLQTYVYAPCVWCHVVVVVVRACVCVYALRHSKCVYRSSGKSKLQVSDLCPSPPSFPPLLDSTTRCSLLFPSLSLIACLEYL